MTDTRAATERDRDTPPASPSGATDQTKERVQKFDEEGGDQPQAPSEQDADKELAHARKSGGHAPPKHQR